VDWVITGDDPHAMAWRRQTFGCSPGGCGADQPGAGCGVFLPSEARGGVGWKTQHHHV